MTSPLRIAVAGLGTVGMGTVELLTHNKDLIAGRCGRKIEIAAVSARKVREVGAPFLDNPMRLLEVPGIDVIVELIGGAEGIARALAEAALTRGVSVVTANKALIAHHGVALARAAEASGAVLAFEAAVAGGIPIVKALRDGLAANRFQRIAGILNGTCNYILTRMEQEHKNFEEILQDAQSLGYAEADAGFDVDGIDTAHKIAILASLAFDSVPDIAGVHVEGIRSIGLRDMEFARELGYRIKLLGIAEQTVAGIVMRVYPCMVPHSSPLATVQGVYNAVMAEGDAVGSIFFEGRGAGAGPTASSVVADIMDIARGAAYTPFAVPAASLRLSVSVAPEMLVCAYYLRLSVGNRTGVLAEVTGIFRDCGISVQSFLQPAPLPGEEVQVVLTTHETTEGAMVRAIAQIVRLPAVNEQPYWIRIAPL